MGFEWDDDKNASNQRKHGISFLDAAAVFDDPLGLVEDSSRLGNGEARWKIIGLVGTDLITVIFTIRGDRHRIISAKRVRISERRQYDQGAAAR